MYRLLSHVLALIDESVISIEIYVVEQRSRLPLSLLSPGPVSQCGSLCCGHLGQLRTSLIKCELLGIRVTTMDKDIC